MGIGEAPNWGDYDPELADMEYIAERRMWASQVVPLMRGLTADGDSGSWAGGYAQAMLNSVDAAIQSCLSQITGQTMRLVVVTQVTHSVFTSPTDGTPWLLVTVVAKYNERDKEAMRRRLRAKDANKAANSGDEE